MGVRSVCIGIGTPLHAARNWLGSVRSWLPRDSRPDLQFSS
jgi:hypothetical protein